MKVATGTPTPPGDFRRPAPEKAPGASGEAGGENEGESLYRALLKGLYDAILIVDKNGGILDGNRRAHSFFRYSPEEFVGANIGGLVSGMTPDLLARIRKNLAGGRFTVLDAVCVRRDRSRFPSEITLSRLTTDRRDDLVFTIRNITRRRAMEERLRTEHNALQNSASGIVITDRNARITYANPAFLRLVGATEQSVLGHDIRGFWEDSPALRALVEHPREGREWTGELTVSRSGTRGVVQATASANRDVNESPVGMVFSFVDITQQQAAQEAIRAEAEAQIRTARQQDAFAGRLKIISLTDVMQLINTTGKNGTLGVFDGEDREIGRVSFKEGEPLAARFGDKRGEEAVIGLLCAQDAVSFQFNSELPPPEPDGTFQKSLMSLLMESAQVLDEDAETPGS